MNRIAIRAAAALVGLAASAGLAAAENYGRVTAAHEVVRTTIFPAGDADDLVFDAGAGWKVKASIKFKGQVELPPPDPDNPVPPPVLTPLLPVLELIAPDGSVETAGVVAKAAKKSASVKATLAEGGRFALRLRGSEGTGIVELKWTLKPGKTTPVKNVPLAADSTTDFGFAARGGALVSWKLSIKGDSDTRVVQIIDPAGVEVPFDPNDTAYVTRKVTSETARNVPLPAGRPGGQYKLRVFNEKFPSTMNLSITVAMPKAPAETVTLTRQEPVLTEIGRDEAGCGIRISLSGTNLDASPQGVLFGATPALSVAVTQGGSSELDLDSCAVTVPGGSGRVDVTFVAADGQRSVLPDSFTFSPLPVVSSFSPVVGPGVGNITLTVHGSGFEYPSQGLYQIVVREVPSGGVATVGIPCFQVQVLDSGTITGKMPAFPSGPTQILVRNLCNEDSIAPGVFTYGASLNISTVVPSAVPTFGGLPVVIYGVNFGPSDVVWLDGNPISTTPVIYGTTVLGHRIASVPAHPAGKVDIKVVQGVNEAEKLNGLAYYEYTDISADNGSGVPAIPPGTATDDWGGVSTAAADSNGDGKTDYIVITDSAALSASRPGTRILKNNGTGVFSDATGSLMPVPTAQEGFGGNKLLVNDFFVQAGVPRYPDIYLSRAGTGTEARKTSDGKFINGWGLLLFGSEGAGYTPQSSSGGNTKLSIPGTLTYSKCYIYNYDYRSVAAALGDLDSDFDQDIVLVNDVSIATFTGVNCGTAWQTCAGGYYTACYSYTKTTIGSALRLCLVSSSGSVFDRTGDLLQAVFSASDDFRGVAVAVGDVNRDLLGLNDVVVTHNTYPGGTLASCTRFFLQKQDNFVSSFVKAGSALLPAPSSGTDDDWRGNTVAIPDLNSDLYRDLVIGYDGPLPSGRPYSTRILIQNSTGGGFVDRTAALLAGNLPAGDYGRAKFVLCEDIDGDGDRDIMLATPNSTGAGNPQTRLLLNVSKDDLTGLPVFVNATSIIPVQGADTGSAVTIVTGDIDGDGDQDLIVTDARSATTTRKTRIWRQDR